MNPERELDVLIAEKVFGMDVQKDKYTQGMLGIALKDPSPNDPEEYYIGSTNERVSQYSSRIEDAWKVFETAYFDGWAIGRNANGKWEIFNTYAYEGYELIAVADTVPLAICLAALKAVGHDIECDIK